MSIAEALEKVKTEFEELKSQRTLLLSQIDMIEKRMIQLQGKEEALLEIDGKSNTSESEVKAESKE